MNWAVFWTCLIVLPLVAFGGPVVFWLAVSRWWRIPEKVRARISEGALWAFTVAALIGVSWLVGSTWDTIATNPDTRPGSEGQPEA